MKHALLFVMTLLFSVLLSGYVSAASSESELIDTNRLESAQPQAALDAYGTLDAGADLDVQALLKKFWCYCCGNSENLKTSALQNGAEIVLISFLAALCCALTDSEIMKLIGAAAVALVCVKGFSSCAFVGKEAIQTLADYSHVLLPCLSTAAAAGGAWTSAAAKYAVSALAMDLMITAEQNVAAPLLYAYAAAAIAAHMTEQPILLSVVGIMKQAIKWGLILLTSGFTIYLSVTGILSGTVDAASAKALKTAISGVLPVVGGILSDASGAILSGAQMLRNGVGLVGMLVILSVCVSPFLAYGSNYLVYQIASGFASSFGNKRIGNVIRCIGDVYGFLLGMIGSVSIMLFVSVVSLMKAVSPG